MRFSPIIPTDLHGNIEDELLFLAEQVCIESSKLIGSYDSIVIDSIRDLLRKTNSYYSNLIESEGTHPIDIEKAMKSDFSQDTKEKNLQLLSLVHIDIQKYIESKKLISPYNKGFIESIHKALYSDRRMKPFLQIYDSVNNTTIIMTPGEFRKRDVKVGSHICPSPDEIESMIRSYETIYYNDLNHSKTKAKKLIYALASHHRLVWIHPFLDGNGRIARLLLDAVLFHIDIEGYGLWTISRGLARNSKQYKNSLASADMVRQGDYDGRGMLSNKELKNFVKYMLEISLDQIKYMSDCLRLSTLSHRIETYIQLSKNGMFRKILPKHSEILLKELLLRGEVERGDVGKIIGKQKTVASALIKELTELNMIYSDTPRGTIKLKFNSHFASYVFPNIFPILEEL